MLLRSIHCAAAIIGLFALCPYSAIADTAPTAVDFNRDIRPILSNHCWSCHGVDEKGRQAGLRLDVRESATAAAESGDIPIVPGKPDESQLIARIETADEDLTMPPPSAKKPLTTKDREMLRRWVAEGAPYAPHWAFVSIERPELPDVHNRDWVRNPIDRFVLHRLEAQGLAPSPEADRATWLRRVTLDLTGLPPTIAERTAFLADNSHTAYENVVDRLMESPRHAEKMALHWLDAARYADTNGYNNDDPRTMWPWRDWVIRAFASGMPYDQFLIEQLAGDLLPDATLDQRVATGFNRNHVVTTEGGIIEDEYRAEYVADRLHTAATVFMALSMQCARCHDHKYDPITQRDYYRFAAFFANVPDRTYKFKEGEPPEPYVEVPTAEQQAELTALAERRSRAESTIKEHEAQAPDAAAKWAKDLAAADRDRIAPAGALLHLTFDDIHGMQVADTLTDGCRATILGEPKHGPGKLGQALEFDGQTTVEISGIDAGEGDRPNSFAAWVKPSASEPMAIISCMDDTDAYRGFDILLEGGKVATHLVHSWPDNAIKVIGTRALKNDKWHHVVVTYDGSRHAAGIAIYIDGKPEKTKIVADSLSESLHTKQPLRIGRRSASIPFNGWIDDVQVFGTVLSDEQVAQLADGIDLTELHLILNSDPTQGTAAQQTLLTEYYLRYVDVEIRDLKTKLANVDKEIGTVRDAIPRSMIMSEMSPRRPTHILDRGQYDQPLEEVTAGVPSAFMPLPDGVTHDRLALAQWLVDPRHPLTARVAINRWWEMLFGIGLVETSADFGVQGALPSDPELLDWLASELIHNRWNPRALIKQIVLSATYRQSSAVSPALLSADPQNRLLARGPRGRLPAEAIRDSALFSSGLLHEQIGGPSVKPYQPDGLWEEITVERRGKYVADKGTGLYRRSLYTFWKRTCPPPAMTTFGAPDRETCVVRRALTNTPLQALVLLNDPTYIEAARKLAELALTSCETNAERLNFAFLRVLCRPPRPDELEILCAACDAARTQFVNDPAASKKLLSVGNSPINEDLNTAELGAWTVAMSMLLNLDEAISKQ